MNYPKPKKVTKFETSNGKFFDTIEAAQREETIFLVSVRIQDHTIHGDTLLSTPRDLAEDIIEFLETNHNI